MLARYRPALLLARAVGIPEGEAATFLVAVVLALVLTLGGLPPVLRNRGDAPRLPSVQQARSGAASPPTQGSTPVTSDETALPGLIPADESFVEPSLVVPAAPSAEPEGGPAVQGPPPPATGQLALFARVAGPGAPDGIAVDLDGTVYVATNNGTTQGEAGPSHVLVFAPDGTRRGEIALQGQPDGHALGLTGLTLEKPRTLIALDAATGRVIRVDVVTGQQTEVARLPNLSGCPGVPPCEVGVSDDGPLPRGIASDGSGTLYVTDASQGVIWRIAAGGSAEPWLVAPQFATGNGLGAVVVEPEGSLLVTAPEVLDPQSLGGGGVYRVPVNADGTAGTPALVAPFAAGELPTGLALTHDGSMAVALAGIDAVALLGGNGAEVRRVTGTAAGLALDTPTNLAFSGLTLLATNQAPATPANWAVLAVGIR
jgi:sugar lactone lactonase YvrE